jgi:hypothetical protein
MDDDHSEEKIYDGDGVLMKALGCGCTEKWIEQPRGSGKYVFERLLKSSRCKEHGA